MLGFGLDISGANALIYSENLKGVVRRSDRTDMSVSFA
jgi:hypothetical protein